MADTEDPRAPKGTAPGRSGPRGFTIFELVIVLSIAAVLLGVVGPRLVQSSTSVALINAASRVSSAVSLARASATRYGRVGYLVLDVAADRIRVDVDTSFVGNGAPVVVHSLDLWNELGVDLRATKPLICFDPRGLSVTTATCPGTGVVIYLQRGQKTDSVVVSSTGRITR